MRISDWSSDVCASDLDSVEKRADKSSNLSSGAKARALIVAADRVATRSSGASAISTCAKPSSATTARKNSQRRLRDSTSRTCRALRIATTSPGKDPKSVVSGKSVSVSVDHGGSRNIKKKKNKHRHK